MKQKKMTRKKRQEDFGTINAWLEHKAILRRKKKEEGRKRAAERMNKEFTILQIM